jgi:hypothetical protein
MKIIHDGNFTGIAICGIWLVGAVIFFSSLEWLANYYLRAIGFSVGIAIMGAGGYAGRAKALGLKPFDNAYKNARASYKDDIK